MSFFVVRRRRVGMHLRNRHGVRIDPVPFVVVVGLAFMFLLSFGPLYG
ncbi:hypothetical protein NJ7G_1652 [Natrinema sp. J7-2]|nr:hypothetical protein NJ7G_1652 [Natrinema sp. J7-2]